MKRREQQRKLKYFRDKLKIYLSFKRSITKVRINHPFKNNNNNFNDLEGLVVHKIVKCLLWSQL